MHVLSQTTEKKPRKYCIIKRAIQAQAVNESSGQPQRDLAKNYNIPRTTLQHWIERKISLSNYLEENPFLMILKKFFPATRLCRRN